MASDADNIIDLYRRHAGAFARDRGQTGMEQRWLDRFLAALPPGGSVLDLGCGFGDPMARCLVDRGCSVTGIDSSAPLIAMARAAMPGFEWHVGDMRGLNLGRRFDGILAWDSFFHLTAGDQRAMFPVFEAHAAPGAALMFTSGPEAGEAVGRFEGEPLYHASLDPSEYRALLAAHGFAVAAHVANDPECGGHTVWLGSRRG